MNIRPIFLIVLLITFVGCNKKIKQPTKALKAGMPLSRSLKLDYQQILALHSEIPDTLLGFEVDTIIKDAQDSHALEVIYKPVKNSKMSLADIKKSYIADMEMLGWKMIGEFESHNIQLIFQKAGAKLLSTVMIQQDFRIIVTVYSKR